VPQLAEDEAAARVHRVRDGAPGGDLGGRPDAGDVEAAGGAAGDERGFADEEGAGNGGALGIVLWRGWSAEIRKEGDGNGPLAIGSGTQSSSARYRVSGAMTMRCWRSTSPTCSGVKSFDILAFFTRGKKAKFRDVCSFSEITKEYFIEALVDSTHSVW
jgi:hypothetical protein